jgi:hypothetical protein
VNLKEKFESAVDIPFGSKLHQMVNLPGQRIMMIGGEKPFGAMSNGKCPDVLEIQLI